MIILNNGNDPDSIYWNGNGLSKVYYGNNLVWPSSSSDTYTIMYTEPTGGVERYVGGVDTLKKLILNGEEIELSEISKWGELTQCYTFPSAGTYKGTYELDINLNFRNNQQLTYIEIPSGITTIGNDAFGNCITLKTVIIPSSVTSISPGMTYGAFGRCSSLEKVVCYAINPPTIADWDHYGRNAFPKDGTFTVYVPDESVDAYKNDDEGSYDAGYTQLGWKAYADRIRPISEMTDL